MRNTKLIAYKSLFHPILEIDGIHIQQLEKIKNKAKKVCFSKDVTDENNN